MATTGTTLTNPRSLLSKVPDGVTTGWAPISAATILTAADSGRIFLVTSGAAYAITLPAVATSAGIYYKFIHTDTKANAVAIAITGAAALMAGHWRQVNGTATAAAGDGVSTGLSFTATADRGDVIDVYCDGIKWYCYGSTTDCAGMAWPP